MRKIINIHKIKSTQWNKERNYTSFRYKISSIPKIRQVVTKLGYHQNDNNIYRKVFLQGDGYKFVPAAVA